VNLRLGFTPSNANLLDLDESFRLAVELNLQFIELTHDLHEIAPALQNAARVRELTRTTGVGVTVHLSFVDLNLASLMPGVRENSVARTNRGLEYAADVNAFCGVLHSGLVPLRHPLILPAARAALERSLGEIRPLVPVALENLALSENDLLRGPEELEVITQAAGFGNTIDVGHALVEGCTTETLDGRHVGGLEHGFHRLESYLAGLSNVIHFHLQDNDGTSDQHRALGLASVPWDRVRSRLEGFTGTLNLEVGPDADAVRQSVRFVRELMA
jgi:sugar phosphate isomerase/epimerase